MKNPITTISGAAMLVLAALSTFGIVKQEEAASAGQYTSVIVEAVVGLIAIFKAGDKGSV